MQLNINLNKLSIVIPTFNRQGYALRSMKFWSDYSTEVFVLDGSNKPIESEMLINIGTNINYIHNPISYHKRILNVLDLIKTPYICMQGDDEFFIPRALSEIIEELEKDKELVSCMGLCILFEGFQNEILSGKWHYPEFLNYSILNDSSTERMVKHMNPYSCSTIYSIVHSSVWKTSMKASCLFSPPPADALDELIFEISTCYFGKSKVIPTLMWLRSYENIPVRHLSPPPENFNLSIREWWDDTKIKYEKKNFLASISSLIAKEDSSKKTIEESYKLAIESYVRWLRDILPQRKIFRAKILSLLPKKIQIVLREIKNYIYNNDLNFTPPAKPLLEFVNELASQGIKVDFNEVNKIQNIILKFHENNK